MDLDLLIRNARVIDGSGKPGFDADVGIAAGRIVDIGDLAGRSAHESVDASGRMLAPGFIDVHTHDDRALLEPSLMLAKVSQGVTTVVTGNCGLSLAPCRLAGDRIPPPLDLIATREWLRFPRFADYLDELDRKRSPVNAVTLVGHLSLRTSTMTDFDRPASQAEIGEMRGMLEDALEAGAWGFSTGTFYPPARHATLEEIVAIGEPLRAFGGLYATHMRNEADLIHDALEETFEIGRRLGVRVLISHHKLAGRANHGGSIKTLQRIAQAMSEQPVSLDCYPYNASSTVLRPEFVARASSVLVSWSTSHPECAGRELADIARDWGCTDEEAARKLEPAGAIYFMMDERDVRRILAFPKTMVGSDGMPHDEHPHPRLWGTFPRVLGHYARDERLFSVETAIHKMTGLTAEELGIPDRGRIVPGCAADLALFDYAQVSDQATYDAPRTAAGGIEHVWINGKTAYRDGMMAADRHGQVIRRRTR